MDYRTPSWVAMLTAVVPGLMCYRRHRTETRMQRGLRAYLGRIQ